MKYLIYLGHPAQYHFFKNIVKNLQKNHQVRYLIKTKEVLEPLLKADCIEYKNVLPEGRTSTKGGIVWGLIKREIKVFKEALSFQPDILIGSDPSLAHVGFLLKIPCLTVLEDDYSVIPGLAKITYPFTRHILAPEACDCGKWNTKKIAYKGYMKLAYLHPKRFELKKTSRKKIAFIRLSGLDAYHDDNIKGFTECDIKTVVKKFVDKDYEVQISAEKKLDECFDKYILKKKPEEIHHILSQASIVVSDSQSMTMEAAMLGIPSIRYSDFVGRIGVLEELETKYHLTFGVKPGDAEKLIYTIDTFLSMSDLEDEFDKRRAKMLADKIDVTGFFTWLLEEYPESLKIINENPDFQLNFK